MKDTLPVRVRFGTFELDLKSGELWEHGRKVVLPEQPFQVLRILVEHGGDVVTREVIQKELWPNDTVVEFDHSINAAINKLRRVLGDSAEEPKYIETVARRGYRLMAPVEWLDSSASDIPRSGEGSDSEGGVVTEPELQPASLSGNIVSHYRVLEIVGGGGMGVVYRAEDIKLGRSVALKFLPEDVGHEPRALERFEREARAASALEHSNICPIYEFGEHEGKPFIVMPLLRGQTLRDRLAAAQVRDPAAPPAAPFAVDELLDIAIQIALGLEAAHEKGIIHRDIKPANIFLTDKGVVKILDFGLAKLLQPSGDLGQATEIDTMGDLQTPRRRARDGANLTRLGVAVGTAAYMSPEQVRREQLDARTDLFSFGVVLYEMATGKRAFTGEAEAVLHAAITNRTPVPLRELNATLPPELEPVVNKALEKNRELRYGSAAAMRADLETVKRGSSPLAPEPVPYEPPQPRPWKLWQLTAAFLACVAAIAVGVYWYGHNRARLTDQDSIVLADFANSTSDPVFNDALNTALRVELEQTPFLNLLARDKVRGTLKLLNHPENEKLTPELARDVCLRTNSRAVVAGSIADVGNRYRIALRGVDCQTGKLLAETKRETASRDDVVKTLGIASGEFRKKLGEPEASLQKFSRPLELATSSSPEALRAYAIGLDQKSIGGDVAAVPYFKHAVELDPNFAQAYASLGAGYHNLADAKQSFENLRKAYDLRNRATQRARYYIDGTYFLIATGDREKAIQTFTEWTRTYPKDFNAHARLSAALMEVGHYEKAAAEARESIRLQPNAAAYTDEVSSYLKLNRLEDAQAGLVEAQSLKIGSHLLPLAQYRLAFLKGDQSALEEQLKSAPATSRAGVLSLQSDTESFFGRIAEARTLCDQVAELAKQDNSADTAANCLTGNALQEAEIGNTGLAQGLAAGALLLSSGRDTQARAALAFARAGDLEKAERLSQQLNQDYPYDTMMQNYSLPTIRAAIELQKSNPGKAIDGLAVALPYEMGFTSFEYLYPAYVRGQAYLKAGQGQQAAAEFQKMLDHPGVTENFVTGSLAHLQLGRAQAMMGDQAAARKSYEDFLTLWKDADLNIPILKAAKAEYAKLQ